jgi:hypothetical protein
MTPYATFSAKQYALLWGRSLCPATQSTEFSESNTKGKELKPFLIHLPKRMYMLEYGLINHKLLTDM